MAMTIPQAYVGCMNVVGECWVLGAALHHSTPVYLNIAGPATSVDAVWGKLAQGQETRIIPDQGERILFQAPAAGLFHAFRRKIPTVGFENAIIVLKTMVNPPNAEVGYVYHIHTDPIRTAQLIGQTVHQQVKVATFPTWYPDLLEAGSHAGLVGDCTTYGGIQVKWVDLDATRWTLLIQTGLRTSQLHFPRS